MPDMERINRQLHLHLAAAEERPVVTAYFAGQDHARRQIAAVVAVIAVLGVLVAAAFGC